MTADRCESIGACVDAAARVGTACRRRAKRPHAEPRQSAGPERKIPPTGAIGPGAARAVAAPSPSDISGAVPPAIAPEVPSAKAPSNRRHSQSKSRASMPRDARCPKVTSPSLSRFSTPMLGSFRTVRSFPRRSSCRSRQIKGGQPRGRRRARRSRRRHAARSLTHGGSASSSYEKAADR